MNVLVIGKNSYIGNHIDKWLTNKGHKVEQLDVLTDAWRAFDYSPYDAIVHVAGIVHRPDCKDWDLYKRVNTDMPISIASMFKSSRAARNLKGIYVYFSTMGVYETVKSLSVSIVDENTSLKPESMYGKSKLMAEEGLSKLQDATLQVAFVRPPSVYGKGCKGGVYIRFHLYCPPYAYYPSCIPKCSSKFHLH